MWVSIARQGISWILCLLLMWIIVLWHLHIQWPLPQHYLTFISFDFYIFQFVALIALYQWILCKSINQCTKEAVSPR